jgi:hypothetical protein
MGVAVLRVAIVELVAGRVEEIAPDEHAPIGDRRR